MGYAISTSAKMGAPVELGDGYAVPRAVTFTATGEGAPGLTPPDVHMRFEVRDGVPECVEFRIIAGKDSRGITEADLTVFAIDAWMRSAFREHGMKVMEEDRAYAITGDAEDSRATAFALAKRIGRGGYRSELHLRDVARVYLTDQLGAPIEAVAAYLGVSRSTAARRISDARKAGFIPPIGASDAAKHDAIEALDSWEAARRAADAAPQTLPIDELRRRLGRTPIDEGGDA